MAVGVVVVIWILAYVINLLLDPLRDIPGPLGARFSRIWYLRAISKGDFEKTNINLHRVYGPIVRIAPRQYSLDDPKVLRTIYSHSSTFIKAAWYDASGNPNPESHDLFTDRDPRRHSANRRKVASLYSMTSLVQMESCVVECSALLIQKLTGFAESGRPLNLQQWMQYYAFDVIGLITVNKRFGFLDSGTDQNSLIAALHAYLIYAANVGVYAEWHPFLAKIVALLPSRGMGHLQAFTSHHIAEGQANSSAKASNLPSSDSFLEKLLKMHAQNPEKISLADIFTTCITNVGAGSDTTSISLTALLYNLSKHPSIHQKLREEIKLADKQGKLSSPAITFQESQNLPYLQACIKEALRLHPATGLPLARVVPKGGATLSGRFFPEGEIVGVNAWVIHQNESVFGPDTASYRPERWLGDPARSSEMDRNFLAFGAGARTCIGKNISLMEIGKLVPELVRRFDFELVDSKAPLETQNVWFVKQTNVECRVRLRREA
ncbi:hypothetical protein N7505_004396 [Penicillium chrysogenum]|uniref:Pisatin demethylase n=1 Tax=Penicillium chrysogenum TaxID=5076 RepID=A0ABQ8WF49_PENCH|nr:hypothetical protein N7505_004396 [Penicillium chrysogenum]